ncbi:MAG: efflux RND transporter periplasmic adaptor subunit [Planctomycetota bacterium]
MKKRLVALILRLVLPAAILGLGWTGFSYLSVPIAEEPVTPGEPRKVRSRVEALYPGDYRVWVESNGIVGPHNQVTLGAEVTGKIVETSPKFQVGQFFKSGDLLLKIDDRDYKTALLIAEQERNRAERALDLAEKAHRRTTELVKRNSASMTEMDTTLSSLVQAQNDLEVAKASIDQAKRDLERTQILAPFDGRLVTRTVGLGQLISPGTVIGEVFAVDYAEVRLPIATRDLSYLDLPELEGDEPVDVVLQDSINRDNDAVWKARIVRTEGRLDPNSLELFAIARIDDPFALKREGPVLRVGQPVVARIDGRKLRNVVAIPRDSVRQLDQVHLIDPNTKELRTRSIEPLWSDEKNVIVRSGDIRPGDLIATTMLVYAPEGSVVEIIPSIDAETLAGKPAEGDPTP